MVACFSSGSLLSGTISCLLLIDNVALAILAGSSCFGWEGSDGSRFGSVGDGTVLSSFLARRLCLTSCHGPSSSDSSCGDFDAYIVVSTAMLSSGDRSSGDAMVAVFLVALSKCNALRFI